MYFTKSEGDAQSDESYGSLPETENMPIGIQRKKESIWRQGSPARLFLILTVGSIVTTIVLYCILVFAFGPPAKFTPTLSTRIVIFQEDPLYRADSTPDSDAAWENLTPKNKGLVVIPHPERYHLKQGIENPNGPDVYGLSMIHQIHCLTLTRRSYYDLVKGAKIPAETANHVGHCYDYLRQVVMCNADATIEWAMETKPGEPRANNIDGWGVPHVCRNREELLRWMGDHKPGNDTE